MVSGLAGILSLNELIALVMASAPAKKSVVYWDIELVYVLSYTK